MNKAIYQHWLSKIAATTILYYLSGIIGLSLSTTAAQVSPFWPAAGVALASLFMFGRVASIGVLIGSLLIKIFLLSNTNLLILCSSVAPVIQAYLAYLVLNYYSKHKTFLKTESSILQFFLLIPFFSIISASISVAAFYYSNSISSEDVAITWGTWWVGDTLGTLIFAPLLFIVFPTINVWKQRRTLFGIITIALTAASIVIFQFAQQREEEKITQQLNQINRIFNAEISDRLESYQKNLQAINIFFLSTYHATPSEIKSFIKKVKLKNDGIVYGYGWFGFADLINTAEDAQYSFYSLKPFRHELAIKPLKTIQKQYDECAIGSYIEHHPGPPSSTLYRSIEASISSIENLCASEHLGGVAYIDIDLDSLIQSIANELNLEHLKIQLFDSDKSTILYSSQPDDFNNKNNLFTPQAESLITYKNTFWKLRLQGQHTFVKLNSSWTTWWIFFSSLLFTTVSALGLLILSARKHQIEGTVETKTAELLSVNSLLKKQIKQQKETQILINMQSRILELIVREESHQSILDQLCLYAENIVFEGAIATILIEKDKQLVLSAAPSLSAESLTQFSNINLQDDNNPCVQAYLSGKQQIIEDINAIESPYFAVPFNPGLDIRAYWSTPIQGINQQLVGVLTLTHLSPRLPNEHEKQLMAAATSLASISFERLANSKQLNNLSQAVESSPNGIVISSESGVIEYVNPYFCQFTGYVKEQLIGQLLTDFAQDASTEDSQEFDWEYSLSLGESQRKYMGIKPNGESYWCQQTIASMDDANDQSHHVLSIHQDITDEYITQQILQQQASHDSLTGLFNRTEFETHLDNLTRQLDSASSHALALIDLDEFKLINENCGHSAGDELLKSITQLMEKHCRRSDFLARIGGDKFAIIFEQCPIQKAQSILQDIIQSIIAYHFNWQQKSYNIGASAGLVEFSADQTTSNELLKKAETARYIAKKEGGQRIHVYNESITSPPSAQ